MAENEQGDALDGALADLLDLSLLARQAKWNLVGPTSWSVGLLLVELARFSCDSADQVAERAVMLGHPPDGRAAAITAGSSLARLQPGALRDLDAIAEFVSILDAVADRMHAAFEAFDSDPVTLVLFTHVLAGVERHASTLRALGRV